jgi:hypothetical protein
MLQWNNKLLLYDLLPVCTVFLLVISSLSPLFSFFELVFNLKPEIILPYFPHIYRKFYIWVKDVIVSSQVSHANSFKLFLSTQEWVSLQCVDQENFTFILPAWEKLSFYLSISIHVTITCYQKRICNG